MPEGTTTVVDAGSSGELNFTPFKKYVIQKKKARILAFLNIESLEMIEFDDLPPAYTDQDWPRLLMEDDERFAPMFVNVHNTSRLARRNRDLIVGIKWAHRGLKQLELARKAADSAGTRLMAENHHMPEALTHLQKGDIVTHAYHFTLNASNNRRDGFTEDGKKIHSEVYDSVKRGLLLDVGHGAASFSWKVAKLAMSQGLEPNTISTDLWRANFTGPVYDMPTTMTKFLHLGMSLESVVQASTANAAFAIGRLGEIGTLKPGAIADVTILKMRSGKFTLTDSYGENVRTTRRLIPTRVVRGGMLVNPPVAS